MSDQKPRSHASEEEHVLEYWERHSIFQKSIDQRPADKLYTFYDGPPFATGLPHYGHIVGQVMKDVAPRFWTMKGYRVNRTWGWDCHGLPIENIIEKEFNLGSRKAIEDFGVTQFNDACHNAVLTYAEEWKKTVRRIGRWVDMENSYKTMDVAFMESIWWVFKSLWEKKLIYEGHKPMHVCPRCETALSNFEVGQNYQDVTDISVYAGFTLTSGAYKGAKLVAWTTTPWTLPGNALLAVNKEVEYVVLKAGEVTYLLGKSAWERLSAAPELAFAKENPSVIETIKGSALVGATYEPLFPMFKDHPNAFRVTHGDFVTVEDGTGVVHIAPGFGEDDMKLGKEETVGPIMHVKMNGHFVPEVVSGLGIEDRPVRAKDDKDRVVDVDMIKALAKTGALVGKKKIVHNYPLCWRCDTPLLNYATTSWFVRVTDLKEKLIKNNKKINWVPGNMKEGRFGKWLEGARDWAISRTRFWGTPLPIWRAEDGEIICVGSKEELEKLSGESVTDLHKHLIDSIKIVRDGKTFTRIPDVLDCWFESGSMPYAQLHYPFQNQQAFKHGFPAQFIAEGQDQTRGWFYTLHVLATALFDKPAFTNVVVNGLVLAEDGKKMSKRLKNYPDPLEVIGKHGADAMRYYLMAAPVVHAENLRFSEAGVDEVSKKFIGILRNVFSFYHLYRGAHDGRRPSGAHVLDRWVLARLHETLKEETEAMEAYDFSIAARTLQNFVTDLSTWYLRRSRDRFKEASEDEKEAVATLREVLETFSKMLAPFMPFLAEMMYQEIDGNWSGNETRMSVHLESWPKVDAKLIKKGGLEEMGRVRSLVSRALERRAEAGKPVRQVLAAMTATLPKGETISPELVDVLKDEVNVKEVKFTVGDYAVELDLVLTPALLREGTARELVRKVNGMRKEAGLTIDDRIDLYIASVDEEGKMALAEHGAAITTETLSAGLRTFGPVPEVTTAFRANEIDFVISFEKK